MMKAESVRRCYCNAEAARLSMVTIAGTALLQRGLDARRRWIMWAARSPVSTSWRFAPQVLWPER